MGDAARPLRVYVTTTIHTRLGVFANHSETVASLKKRIVDDHCTVNADVGEIRVYSLRVKLIEYIFVARDDITLGSLCLSEMDKELHISAHVGVATKVITRQQKKSHRTKKQNSSSTDPVKKTVAGVGGANKAVNCDRDVDQLSMDAVVETSSVNAAAGLTDGNETMSSDPYKSESGKKQSNDSNQVVPRVFQSVDAIFERIASRKQRKGSDGNLDVSATPRHGRVSSTMAPERRSFFPPVKEALGKGRKYLV